MTETEAAAPLLRTPLHALHEALGARMVAFAGYEMPVHYRQGILAEHLHTRKAAGLFDVSHMGQVRLTGENAAGALETLVPGDIAGLAPGRMRYTLFLDEAGGILDDLIVTRLEDGLFVVVNAARRAVDIAHLRAHLGPGIGVDVQEDRALLALQGPQAAAVLARLLPGIEALGFLAAAQTTLAGEPALVTRSGYTGEDGFEISLPAGVAAPVAERLLAEPEVAPIGLGARDTLRLEAGLCLWGHDIDETTTPAAAGLGWTIGKRRRSEGGFPGAASVLAELSAGPSRRRVGIRPDGRAPAREGTPVLDAALGPVGRITSGGFGPSLNAPIAMGYVDAALAAPGSALMLDIRGTPRPAHVVPLPFVPNRYHRS